jgi:hypothetical protein
MSASAASPEHAQRESVFARTPAKQPHPARFEGSLLHPGHVAWRLETVPVPGSIDPSRESGRRLVHAREHRPASNADELDVFDASHYRWQRLKVHRSHAGERSFASTRCVGAGSRQEA